MHRSASHGEYTNYIDASSSPPEDCSSIKAHHCCAPIIGNFITKALCLQEERYREKMMSFSLKCIDFFHCPIYFLHGYQDLCQRLVSSRAELDRWHRFTFQYDNFGIGGSDKKSGPGVWISAIYPLFPTPQKSHDLIFIHSISAIQNKA